MLRVYLRALSSAPPGAPAFAARAPAILPPCHPPRKGKYFSTTGAPGQDWWGEEGRVGDGACRGNGGSISACRADARS